MPPLPTLADSARRSGTDHGLGVRLQEVANGSVGLALEFGAEILEAGIDIALQGDGVDHAGTGDRDEKENQGDSKNPRHRWSLTFRAPKKL
jgi:hypothetical protein